MRTFTLVSLLLFASIGLSRAANLPLDFETGTYEFTDFDGGAVTIIDNSQSSDINTSAKVAQMIKSEGQVWGGSAIVLDAPIDFSVNKKFKMKVFSPKVGTKVLLKVENSENGGIFFEKEMLTTVANTWEELVFDYSLVDVTKSFQKIVIIFELGTMGDGTADFTFLFDDIALFSDGNVTIPPSLPIDFESTTITYGFDDFDGGAATVMANPQSSGENTSATVAQIIRNGGATWGGSKLVLDKDIDFSSGSTFSMKVYSARANVPVLFKLEGTAQAEVSTNTTMANQWETLTWDFTGQPSGTFNTLVFMFDFGTIGDGTENSTFLFDDVELIDETGGLAQIDLPVTFDDETVNYAMTDFGGNTSVVAADPVNAGNNVLMTTKTEASETWAGTTIGTALGFATRIPLTETNTKMSVMVYSPTAGIPVRLKVEDHNNDELTAETEAMTTVANAWEMLVFDFSNVAEGTNPYNPETNFDKASIFFNFNVAGAGEVYYFDDVMFYNSTPVSNVELSNISIYANQGVLNINSGNDLANGTIQVYELSGKMIVSKKVNSNLEQINLGTQGVYIVNIIDANQIPVKSQKVLSR